MHISDGLLPVSMCAAGYVAAGGLTLLAIRRLDEKLIPRTAVMTSAFFAASLIHLKLGPASVHLMLGGLVGAVIGWRAVVPIAVGLVLQCLLFGHGGITSLGVNTLVMGLPAMLAGWFFSTVYTPSAGKRVYVYGFVCGVGTILLSMGLFLLVGLAADERYFVAVQALVLAHIPLAILEGAVTAAAVGYLHHVKPDALATRNHAHHGGDIADVTTRHVGT